jgi:hypothetical protein
VPHIIQFCAFVLSFQISFRNIFKLLSGLIARKLDGSSTILWDCLLISVVVWEGESIWAIWAVGVVDNCIDIRWWGIECSPNLFSTLFYLLSWLSCLLLFEAHLLDLHDIIIFLLPKTDLLVLWTTLHHFIALYVTFVYFGGGDVGNWPYLLVVHHSLFLILTHSWILILFHFNVGCRE